MNKEDIKQLVVSHVLATADTIEANLQDDLEMKKHLITSISEKVETVSWLMKGISEDIAMFEQL